MRRHRMQVRRVPVLAAAVLTLSSIGCSGGEEVEAAAAVSSSGPVAAQTSAQTTPAPTQEAASSTILDVLAADGRFTIFLELFGDSGPLARPDFDNTLFAPTDQAFAALGDAALTELRDDSQQRMDLLRRHVTPGRQRPEHMEPWLHSGIAKTAAAGSMAFTISRAGYGYELVWGGATVIEANLEASNGLVHVLDAVAVPQEDP